MRTAEEWFAEHIAQLEEKNHDQGKNLREIRGNLPAVDLTWNRRQRIEQKTQELEAEYLASQELQQLVGIT